MTLNEMDADLAKYDDFEQLSNRVPYWERRFKLTNPDEQGWREFEATVGKHSFRALGVMRAG